LCDTQRLSQTTFGIYASEEIFGDPNSTAPPKRLVWIRHWPPMIVSRTLTKVTLTPEILSCISTFRV